MERGALLQADFKDFGKKVILFAHITSHVPGEPYPELLKEKGGRGFPTFYFLDSAGKVLGEPDGRSASDFEAKLKEILPKMPPPKPGKYTGPKIHALKDALADGKMDGKVILLVIKGDEKRTEELTKLLYGERLKKEVGPFLVVEHTFDKDDDLCKKLGVKEGPGLLAIDPRKEKTEESVLARFGEKVSQEKLSAFLKKWEKAAQKK